MKNKMIPVFLIVLSISFNCFGMELNESQKKILKYYPSWTKKQKITYFTETSNYFSESCPQTIDKMSTLLTVEPFLEEPGLKYIIKFSVEKIVNSKKEWDDLFKDIRMNLKNDLCSNPSYFFFKKLKDMFLVFDYYDKNSIFLKRLSFDLNTNCAE